VVLASGEMLTTSAATSLRFYGPDLTGLFTGDCGVFGIKVAVRLPLLPVLAHAETVSFAFDSFADFHAAARIAQTARVDDSWFAIDMALSQGQIARQEGMSARLKIAAEVMRKAPDKLKGLAQLVKMAVAGENPMRAGEYMMHFIVEGFDAEDAAHRARHLRRVLTGKGREIANTVPAFVRSLPFAPLHNILGPGGERWVPIHGVLAHDQAVAFDTEFKALVEERQAEMDRLGVWLGTMFSPAAQVGFLYEIALYWPDSRSAYHDVTLGAAHLARIPAFPASQEARAFVEQLKGEFIALMQAHGAGHFQIGRAYPYQQRLDPEARELVKAIKAELDPKGLMNPGALGF
jgi:glycolate oxidase